ncbi:MAG TPA: cytochrome c [Gammaproteobacteria bacterium]|nr:cytochrome c [Gammaproteobacteria bacterium]
MKTLLMITSAMMLCLLSLTARAEGDYAAGQQKAKEICAACHNADGNSTNAMYPKLAGQWESYIVQALKEYKSGERKNPIMGPMAAPLTEQEVENAAVYFSQQKPAVFVLQR